MKRKIGLDYLEKNIKSANTELKENSLLETAATKTHFEVEELVESHQKVRTVEQQEIIDFRQKATEFQAEGTTSLSSNQRNDVFKKLEKEGRLQRFFQEIERDPEDAIQNLLYQYVSQQAPPLEQLSSKQLAITYKIHDWLRGTKVRVPEKAKVDAEIKRRGLIAPFEKMTLNFQGRKEELKQLSEYVNWLPEYDNIINWHEKPPLMIYGIGGVGKSTLIAKFILQHLELKQNQHLPFVYLDFDRTGLSLREPIQLLKEGLKQIAVQFPEHRISIDRAQTFLTQGFLGQYNNFEKVSQTRSSSRGFLYSGLEENFPELKNLDTPILMVLDSFEEIQYRASITEIITLLDFLSELSSLLPRLRVVIAGRSSLMEQGFEHFEFETLKLDSFDEQSAIAYLQSLGVSNEHLALQVYQNSGGNPLTLQLAAEVVSKAFKEKATAQITEEEIQQLFETLDQTSIQQQLFKRNLSHIHDPQVREIALPGLVVRKVNPDVIQKILAEPCGLGQITAIQATDLYDELTREKFLIENGIQSIEFRADLRKNLYKYTEQEMPKKVKEIHNLAISFYENHPRRETFAHQAEVVYHRLMRGDDPEFLDKTYKEEFRPFLEKSLNEFPPIAYFRLGRLMGITPPKKIIDQLTIKDWEDFIQEEFVKNVKEGDESTLHYLKHLIETRNPKSKSVQLLYLEARINWRLGQYEDALHQLDLLQKTSIYPKNPNLQVSAQQLIAFIHEYNKDYEAALASVLKALAYFPQTNKRLYIELIYQHRRLCNRLGKKKYVNYLQLSSLNTKMISSRLYYNKEYIKSIFMVSRWFNWVTRIENSKKSTISLRLEEVKKSVHWTKTDWDDFTIKQEIGDLFTLEELFYGEFDIYLNAITEPGSLKVLETEYWLFKEQIGLENPKERNIEVSLEEATSEFVSKVEKNALGRLKKEATELIAKAKTKEALELIRERLSPNSSHNNQVMILLSRASQLERNKNLGLVSFTEASLTLNQINIATLYLVNEIEEGDLTV